VVSDKEQYCAGCRNDFYNHRSEPGFDGATKCWSLNDATVVTRYRIGWWTQPTSAKAFQKVTTLDCHHAPGQYAHYKELPEHCR
jgi:hypothetical protein